MDATTKTEGLGIRRVPLDELHLDPVNAREHGERNREAIRASLVRFGQAEPLVVHKDSGRVIGGNGRLAAMRDLGWAECDVVEIETDVVTATALGIALNRTADLAGWDEPVLAQILASLREEDALDAVGFSDSELDELIASIDPDAGEVTQDDIPDPEEHAVSQPGDLWVLGDQRLLCGDSTKLADVERVMAGDEAVLVATDPPYLVDYTGERPNDSGKDWSATYHEIEIEDAEGFFRAVFENVLAVLGPNGAIYVWHAHKRQALIARLWDELGIVDHQQIVWVKPTPVFGRVYWHFQHEPCVMGWRKGSQPDHDGSHEHSSVWTVTYDDGKGKASGDHPTQKPLELFARPMRKHTKAGDIVFEPFSGSGSQLVAAEQLGRRCRAIEIEPVFVDVAIRRWEALTGSEAVLDGTGETFAQVESRRTSEAEVSG